MKPYDHAEASAKLFGGTYLDYIEIHKWFDTFRYALGDPRHRMFLHNTVGVILCEQTFGDFIENNDGKKIAVRDIAEHHIITDLNKIPTPQQWLKNINAKKWVRPKKAKVEKLNERIKSPQQIHSIREEELDKPMNADLDIKITDNIMTYNQFHCEHGAVNNTTGKCTACGLDWKEVEDLNLTKDLFYGNKYDDYVKAMKDIKREEYIKFSLPMTKKEYESIISGDTTINYINHSYISTGVVDTQDLQRLLDKLKNNDINNDLQSIIKKYLDKLNEPVFMEGGFKGDGFDDRGFGAGVLD